MSLQSLYQEQILDHGKRPRNFGKLPNATHRASGTNAMCGDDLDVEIRLEEGRVQSIRFTGSGCAISVASASLMTELVEGMPVEEARDLFKRFQASLVDPECAEEIEGLECFAGVKGHPSRIKCALLAWHALNKAVEQNGEVSSSA